MTWPAFVDGVGAMFVSCDNDPDVQAARIPGLTWAAVKTNGADDSPPDVRIEWLRRMDAHAQTGTWVYAFGPPEEDVMAAGGPFVIYDVEKEYKTDEGAPSDYPARLVAAHNHEHNFPAAVTSYGQIPGNNTFPSSIDFRPFVEAGWPMFAQAYDGFTVIDAESYTVRKGGPYPASGVHSLVRSLRLVQGQAVYRPESIDG